MSNQSLFKSPRVHSKRPRLYFYIKGGENGIPTISTPHSAQNRRRYLHSAFCLEDLAAVRAPLVHLPTNLRTSSINITGKATANTNNHSFRLRGTMPNIWARKGTYRIRKCRPNETDIAIRSQGLTQGGIDKRLPSSDRALSELNISIATSTERERVMAFTFPV